MMVALTQIESRLWYSSFMAAELPQKVTDRLPIRRQKSCRRKFE